MAINQIVCTSAGANTGVADCSLTLQNIAGGFLVPNSFELSAVQLASSASILAALREASIADSASARIFPLPEAVGTTDNTGDVTVQTFGYGATVPVRDGDYDITLAYIRGGNCVNNALRKFNNGNYRVILFDSAGILFGTKVGQTMKGIPLNFFYAAPFRFNDGTNVTAFAYRLSFRPVYINEGLGFAQLDLASLLALSGLQNVNTQFVSRALGVVNVTASAGCGGRPQDFYALYSTELASASLWRATQNGLNITITSVAVNANTNGWTITLDTADPDYQAGQPVTINLAPVSVLDAAGVVGYEGIPLTTTT